MTEDMFDISIVCWLLRIAEATLFCFQSVKFSKTFGFSIVHLVYLMIATIELWQSSIVKTRMFPSRP